MCIRPSFISKMKKFHNEKEILESNLSAPIKRVLHQHLLEICNTYGIDDISAFGSICYIESSTDLENLDLSVIESHMQELHLKELKIVNLFSKVVSGKMSSRGLEVDEENMKYIETLMSDKNFKNTKFIVAWGNSMASSYACKKSKVNVLNMFKNAVPKGIVLCDALCCKHCYCF